MDKNIHHRIPDWDNLWSISDGLDVLALQPANTAENLDEAIANYQLMRANRARI
jgi:hypothetical protein